MNHDEIICRCALNRIFGFSPATGTAIIEGLGSAAKAFQLSDSEKTELFGPFSKYSSSINSDALESAEKEIINATSIGARFVCKGMAGYPPLLAECEDAPLGLYILSNTPAERLFRTSVSIVGTRDISLYGREWCEKLVRCLSSTKEAPTIVSGLAVGTDITAHATALECGIGTIAVMATGIDSVYPRKHTHIARRMAQEENCALITDYPIGSEPKQINFVRRNRIIAGISGSTILIESKIRGGGMITARQAFSYSRNVYALPGRIDDIRSQGCNFLIRKNEAEPITDIDSLISSLCLTHIQDTGQESLKNTFTRQVQKWGLTDPQREKAARILLTIKQNRGISLTAISEKCGMEYREVAELTGILANDGFIDIDLIQRCTINSKY